MDKEIINILKSHGCLYMAEDYKELLNDIEKHYKHAQALQLLQPDVIGSASVIIFGERRVWVCPFCEKNTQDYGDKRNNCPIVVGEMICTDCRKRIRSLIGL